MPKNVKGSSRRVYIPEKDALKVLKALPDSHQWRLLFVLSCWGGLRVGSEVRLLRWGDIYWKDDRFRVHSPKTEHHEGRDSRLVPLFPELRKELQAVQSELLEDFDPKAQRLSEQFVLPMLQGRSDASFRATIIRAIKVSGVKQ